MFSSTWNIHFLSNIQLNVDEDGETAFIIIMIIVMIITFCLNIISISILHRMTESFMKLEFFFTKKTLVRIQFRSSFWYKKKLFLNNDYHIIFFNFEFTIEK